MQCLPLVHDVIAGMQSALAPGGPDAAGIARLSSVMFAGAAVIFALVMLLLAWALFAPVGRRAWLGHRNVVLVGGLALPVFVLTTLLVYGLSLARALVRAPDEPRLRIEVRAEQFFWRVRYEPEGNRPALVTANEIHVPAGRPVQFALTTADVIHSFWIPTLGGKLDMIPGQTNTLVLTAARPGVYRGQCAEFCGGAHALMAFDVVVHTVPEFGRWRDRQQRPAAAPAIPFVERGKALFLSSGCGACHTVRGTPAGGRLGPDLTHVGSRRSIAAGSFPNDQRWLAAWVSSSQHLKPNSRMPSFNIFTEDELRALAAYLESLR